MNPATNSRRQQLRAQARAEAFREVTAKYGLEPRRARRRIALRWARERVRQALRARRAVPLVAALLALLGAVPQTQAQGTRKDDLVINARGLPVGGASVAVCTNTANTSTTPCSPLALIYSDPALTQALVNPISTDGLGNYSFYATPGKYKIQIYGPTITTRVIPDVILPNDPSAPSFSSVTTTSGITAFSLTLSGNLTVTGSANVTLGLSAATLGLTNQSSPPGAPAAGNVTLYSKTADKKLYFKDDTGSETGPLGAGAQTNAANTWTASQTFNADALFKSGRPLYDVMAFGASGSAQNTTGSMSFGSAALTLTAAQDFKNGQGIAVYGAGPVSSLAAPTGLTVTFTPTSFYIPKGNAVRASNVVTITTVVPHFYQAGDSITVAGMADTSFNGTFTIATVPSTISFTYSQTAANATTSGGTVSLTAGSTTYTYRVAAIDASGGMSAPSSAVSVSTSIATLRASGYSKLSWNGVTGAVMYGIYGRSGSLVAIDVASSSFPGTTAPHYEDIGQNNPLPTYVPSALPAGATNQVLLTTISSGAGTTSLTLSATASGTVSAATVEHDDTGAIQSAWNQAKTNGGIAYAPIGTHNFWNLDLTTSQWTALRFDGQLSPHIPIVVKSLVALVGGSGGGSGFGNPSKPTARILHNNIEPVVSIPSANVAYVANIDLPHLHEGIRVVATDNVLIDNVHTSTNNPPGGSAIRIDNGATGVGGFSYTIRDCSLSMTGGGAYPSLWATTTLAIYMQDCLVNGTGIRIDGAQFTTAVNGPFEFSRVLTENMTTSFLMVDGTGGATEQFTLNRIEMADNLQTNNSLIANLTSTAVRDFTVINSRGWGGNALAGDGIHGAWFIGGIGFSGTGAGLSGGSFDREGSATFFQNNNFPVSTSIIPVGDTLLSGTSFYVKQRDTSTPIATWRAQPGPTGNLFEWQDSTGAVRAAMDGTNFRYKFGNSAGTFFHTLDGTPTANRTHTFPDNSGTVAELNLSQTFNADQSFTGQVLSKRIRATQGSALVAGDFALSAGWGTTASVGTITGTDQGWQATVTSSGTGQAANPTVTLTFHDGTWTNSPICVTKMVGGTGTITQLTEAPTATTNVITFNGTPVNGSTYILASICMGR